MHGGTEQHGATAVSEQSPATCRHAPDAGTSYTTTGLPVDLKYPSDFPADAKCSGCGEWIRCNRQGGGWQLKYPEEL